MRTLSILLCSLLVLAPAKGQQAVQQTAPRFYVPYGVRDAAIPPLEEVSSSDTEFGEPYTAALAPPAPQMRRRYPMRGRRFQRYGSPYGMYPPQQPDCSVAGAIVGAAIATALLVALATAHD